MKEGLPVKEINFGITEINHSNRLSVTVINEYEDKVTLSQPIALDNDVQILSYPEHLGIGEEGQVILEFKPSKQRKESLKNTDIQFRVIIG